jgi:hypothetical protein
MITPSPIWQTVLDTPFANSGPSPNFGSGHSANVTRRIRWHIHGAVYGLGYLHLFHLIPDAPL